MSERFNALVLEEADRKVTASVKTLGLDELPAGEVTGLRAIQIDLEPL